ncbi:hypothetical protein BSKO_01781 [Bryopsis sp. KO-2023]|nr:hypothetical protein BSKO_01781 [Bryopsis sp. KO-2023]
MSLDFPPCFGRDGSPVRSIDSMLMAVPPAAKYPAVRSDFHGFANLSKTAFHGPSMNADMDYNVAIFSPDLNLPDFPVGKPMQGDLGEGELETQKRITGRKRQKADSEERKERQAAKNRETAKAFRNKMDTLKNYSEARVFMLKVWIQGLGDLAFTSTETPVYTPLGVRRSLSSPF